MDDLAGKIGEILSNPGALEQIKSLAGMLGAQTQDTAEENPPVGVTANAPAAAGQGLDLSALSSLLGSLGNAAPAAPAEPAGGGSGLGALGALGSLGGLGSLLGGSANSGANSGGGINGDLLGMVAKMGPVLGALRQEDDSTRLLRALRPMLRPTRQKKLDEALKLLQLLRALPLLKQSGILGSLGGLL